MSVDVTGIPIRSGNGVIRRNILWNSFGGGSAALVALALIPLQTHQLGLEAYGLIGFLASLQVLFSLFDVGLSPGVTWYLARQGVRVPTAARAVLSILIPIYSSIGIALGVILAAAAGWLATSWLRFANVTPEYATVTIQLVAVAVAIRWPVSLLAGVIAGFQRFDVLNKAKASHAVIHLIGSVVVLFLTPSLIAFAMWLVLSALVETSLYAVASRGYFRQTKASADYRGDIHAIRRYAQGIAVIGALSLVLTQIDRVALGRLVSAADLGAYAATYNLLLGLTLIQLFVGSALYPAFAADFAAGQLDRIRARSRDATQLIMFLFALPFAILVVFGEPILDRLLTPDTAPSAALVLSLLAVGFLFNAASAVPYTLALAGGMARLPIWVNTLNVVWYVPAVIIGINFVGPAGAALSWALLNISYVATLVPIAHRRLLHGGTSRWLLTSVLPFPVLALVALGLARQVFGLRDMQDPLFWLGVTAGAALYGFTAFRLLNRSLRANVVSLLRLPRLAPTER